MTLISSTPQVQQDVSKDLIDFAQFSATNYAAQNYAFIFWNHGIGILDPKWNDLHMFAINPSVLEQHQRIQIEGITEPSEKQKKGILFDIANKSYLNNQGLTSALSYITTHVLHKKFALIGMDACLMSMLEVFIKYGILPTILSPLKK
jgi:Clostripain family.